MVVDGQSYDTKTLRSTSEIDALIGRAKKFPHILGTSAAEYVMAFNVLRQNYDEILAIVTARNTIGTYDAALAAARSLKAAGKETNIHVIDSSTLDLGVGLVVLFVHASAKAGHHGVELVKAAETLGKAGRFIYAPQSLDYLVKGGRASFLAAQAAELFNRRVLLGHIDGESQKVGTFSKSQDVVTVIADNLVDNIGKGEPVWAAVMHGDNPAEAQRLAERLRRSFDVRFLLTREISAGVYMNVGKGAVGAYVTPVRNLPWQVDLNALGL
jgi:DegV family protein with EDD domain